MYFFHHWAMCLFQTTLEMLSSDLVAELRAEVTRWWEEVQQRHQQRQKEAQQQQQGSRSQSSASGSILTPILGAMLGDGPIRMITQGQELTADMDEKTLGDMQFKDFQVKNRDNIIWDFWILIDQKLSERIKK